jgi:hypothetical protein
MSEYLDLWKETWAAQKASQITSRGFTEADVRAGGRATKLNPNKEDETWWNEHGPGMIDAWVDFRNTSGWQIAVMPNGDPAIEVAVNVQLGGMPVQMHIDRIMWMANEDGDASQDSFAIIDLKTGAQQPKSDLQLAFYAAGLEKAFGWRPRWGGYWMSRKQSLGFLTDLNDYPLDMIEGMMAQFKRARDNEIMLPNMSHCVMCGVKDACKWRNVHLWTKQEGEK